jgi:hypothetical protein
MTGKTFNAFSLSCCCYFFYMQFSQKVFGGVFEIPLLRNAAMHIRGGGGGSSKQATQAWGIQLPYASGAK